MRCVWVVSWVFVLCAAAMPSAARCVDEDSLDAFSRGTITQAPEAADPRSALHGLVQEALSRSHSIGASQLLAAAAAQDIEEARAAKALQASAGVSLGPAGARDSDGISANTAAQLRASVTVSQLLYDGGRQQRLVDWRGQLAESARLGNLNLQEQVALTTVGLAVERSRLRSQVHVGTQLMRKMSCLVRALETIVAADRGRTSELVQAKQSLEQADLSLTQTQSLVRQVEIRLRRLAGDGLPPIDGLTTVFSELPPLEILVADVERSFDIAQLGAQALAAGRLADATAANRSPQLSWQLSAGAGASAGRDSGNSPTGNYSLGLTVNIPLLAPGVEPSLKAARNRAEAANLQRADALEAKRFRVAEVHEQARSSLDRATRLASLLRSSDQVRNFTLQQWQQLGRRSLFDVMSAEAGHYGLRVAYVNALHDVQQLNANLLSLGRGVGTWLR